MGRKRIDLTGQRFGNLVVTRALAPDPVSGQVFWKCQCDCGGTHTTLGQTLRRGQAQRCPACIKAGRVPIDTTTGGITVVRLWFYQAGLTGGFATARDLETGELLAHSNWSRKPLGGQSWYAYGPLRYVLKRLVHTGRAKPKKPEQTMQRWCRQNAIQLLEPSWITARPQLEALWEVCLASGKGPQIIELDRGEEDRRAAAVEGEA